MTDGSPSLFPPSSLDEVLSHLAFLSDDMFAALKNEVRGRDGFDAPKERCEHLAKLLGMNAESVALVLSALSYLYTRVSSITVPDIIVPIAQLVEGFEVPDLSEEKKGLLTARLAQLAAQSTDIDLSRKLARLRSGFLKNAVGFTSFLDVRPDFEMESGSVRGFVPMLQFRIVTDAENVGEREFVCQLDDSALAALRLAVEAAEKKFNILRGANILGAPLYVRKWSSDE